MIYVEMNCIKDTISSNYDIDVKYLEPMDYGADSNAERFKVLDVRNNAYFAKVSKELSRQNLELLHYLNEKLGGCIITPLENQNGELYTVFEDYFIVIYPFVEGKNGFEEALTLSDIKAAGQILKKLHSLDAAYLGNEFGIRKYIHNPGYRNQVRDILNINEDIKSEDALILNLKEFIRSAADRINKVLNILDGLNDSISDNNSVLSLCHTDIHVGNILKSSDGELYIVDWDQVAIGNIELDLLFFGGGIAGYISNDSEIGSFFSGYGDCSINYSRLAFYRFARVIEDIALFYNEIMDEAIDYENRKRALIYLQSNFNHNETLDCAFRTLEYITQ